MRLVEGSQQLRFLLGQPLLFAQGGGAACGSSGRQPLRAAAKPATASSARCGFRWLRRFSEAISPSRKVLVLMQLHGVFLRGGQPLRWRTVSSIAGVRPNESNLPVVPVTGETPAPHYDAMLPVNIVWARSGPTETISTGLPTSWLTRSRYWRAPAGRSSSLRTLVTSVCQPGNVS